MDDEGKDVDRRSWTFDKRVTLGEVLTAFGVVLTIYFAGTNIISEFRTANATTDKRLSILEEKASMQQRIDAAQDALTRDGLTRIETSLAEMRLVLRERQFNK